MVEKYAYFSTKLVKNSLSKNSSIVVGMLKRLIVVGRPTRLIVVERLIRIFRPRQKTRGKMDVRSTINFRR